MCVRKNCIGCDVCGRACAPYGVGVRNQYGSCAGACVFVGYASTDFVQYARANGFEQGARVYEVVCVSVGFCAVRTHESLVQCACAMNSCPCRFQCRTSTARGREHVRMSSCMRVCGFVLVCGSVRRGARVRESGSLYGDHPPGLYTLCFCARAGACVDEIKCASLYICTVRANKGFVLLCFCACILEDIQMNSSARACTSEGSDPIRALCGANPQGLYTMWWCLPTRDFYNMLMCSCRSVCR